MATRTYFRTRVAARILTLFFVGAVIPVVVLAGLSQRAVRSQLIEQSESRLQQMADATSQLVLERLAISAARAGEMAARVHQGGPAELSGRLPPSVAGVAFEVGGRVEGTSGTVFDPPVVTDPDGLRLRQGAPVLITTLAGDGPVLRLGMGDPSGRDRTVWAELISDSIFSSAMTLGEDPTLEDMCVFSAALEPLVCRTGPASRLREHLPDPRGAGVRGLTRFEDDGADMLGAWRSVYLRSGWGAPDWYVMVSQTQASALAPASGFTYNLLWALGVALALVLLLASTLVTRTMEPLARLSEGTRRLAIHDLSNRVEISSDDEFGDLAKSFNSMAGELSRQFRQLRASQAIDRAVIEENDITAAVRAMMDGAGELLRARRSAVILYDIDSDGLAALCYREEGERDLTVKTFDVSTANLSAWVPKEAAWLQEPQKAARDLGVAGIGVGTDHVYVAPMLVQSGTVGVAVFTSDPRVEFSADDLERADQLIDRGAIALNEVRLRREITELGAEALRALANAVDAKSRWTAGHSERVTELARAIGARMGLGAQDMDILYRGGLLHDIGKIGIPVEVLDFHGRLTADMRQVVESHPEIGARIIEPVRVFRPLLPLVLHHHERWDGEGYPHGLSGEGIPKLARILAVADVFDAMVSPRPYRGPLLQEIVVAHIHEGIGSAFDPAVVEAFDQVMAAGWVHDRQSSPEGAHA